MKNSEQRLSWATTACRKSQMRLTPVREAILSFLAHRRVPATLQMVSQAEGVRGQCDLTTVYRTLMMFKQGELIRLVGSPQKASYFVLNVPGDTVHFVICNQCGRISELPLPDAIAEELERIAAAQGFSPTPQECEVYGLCASCQAESKHQVTASKLIVKVTKRLAASKRGSMDLHSGSDKPNPHII